jgi:glutathione synthase/RimK-type ligase-like ATP-grasp enzyme
MSVLILTKSDDNECVERVQGAIEELGGRSFRFDTDRFPTEARLTIAAGSEGDRMRLVTDAGEIDLCRVTAVWYRRTHPGNLIPSTMDGQYRRASVNESRAVVYAAIDRLPGFHLDRSVAIQRARNKLWQLQAAREVGLRIPRTLITNDPEEVRRLDSACEGGVITKMMTSFAIHEEGKEKVVFTTPLQSPDAAALEGLRLCPMTFQERVPKALELRVTVVGRDVFTASIDSQAVEGAKEDWRKEGLFLVDDWKAYDLPDEIRDRLLRLMDRLELEFGAIDFIVTPDGDHVFLEVNPIGEFFWLEKQPGFPISRSIASLLLHPENRRRSEP